MGVEIIISHKGKHLFATAERSFSLSETQHEPFKDILRTLRRAFPKSMGYEISVSNWVNQGQDKTGDFADILNAVL